MGLSDGALRVASLDLCKSSLNLGNGAGASGGIRRGLPRSAMRASKLPLSVWAQAFHLCVLSSNADAMDIRDALLPVTQRTSYSLTKRIHEAWRIEGDAFEEISEEGDDG